MLGDGFSARKLNLISFTTLCDGRYRHTHDSWGVVKIRNCQSLEEARRVFGDRRDDLRCKTD